MASKITTIVPTKQDIILYHRDPLLCLQNLMQSPLVQDHISFSPFRLYESAPKMMRIYTEWLSGDQAWDLQVSPFIIFVYKKQCPCADETWARGNAARRNLVIR